MRRLLKLILPVLLAIPLLGLSSATWNFADATVQSKFTVAGEVFLTIEAVGSVQDVVCRVTPDFVNKACSRLVVGGQAYFSGVFPIADADDPQFVVTQVLMTLPDP